MTTLVSVTQMSGCSGDGDTKASSANETYQYQVIFSDGKATAYDARNVTGIPVYGDELVSGVSGANIPMFVSKKTATQNTSQHSVWDVQVTYSTPDINQQPPCPSTFTTGDKFGVQVTCSGIPYSEEIQVDTSGKPIVNTNNEPINPPLVQTKYDRNLKVSFWSDKIDQTNIDYCIGQCNTSSVTATVGASSMVFNPFTLKFNDYSWSCNYDAGGKKFLHIDYDFIYRKDNWVTKVPNESCYSSTAAGLVPLLDTYGNILNEPRCISSIGGVIPNGQPAYMLQFTNLYSTSFASLLAQIP